jgi:hypothetical protein
MNAETFATWLRRQRYQVYRTASSYWFNAGPRVLQAFPYHWQITPGRNETDILMLKHGIVALRYSTPLDALKGKVSYHVVLRQPYELEMLRSQARNSVKCGLSHFKMEQISFERLAAEGWVLQQDTLARQDRLRSMTQQGWERLCLAGLGLPGFETWAATSNGELAGAVIICRIDDVFNVPYAMSHSKFLCDHVNNALFFFISRELLSRSGVKGIFFTVQSLDAPANVDEFKFRMGLSPIPVCQKVEFHPLLRPFVTPAARAWVLHLLKRDPSSPLLAKAEGMVRLHVEGKLPMTEQVWPTCIAGQKDALLRELDIHAFVPEKTDQSPVVADANLDGCQLVGMPKMSAGIDTPLHQPIIQRTKRVLAKPWNHRVKKWLEQVYAASLRWRGITPPQLGPKDFTTEMPYEVGELVRVRSREEIISTLNPFMELKGCTFLPQMYQYCGTQQHVLKSMRHFVDERDYKLRSVHGVVLLQDVICHGTGTLGPCDRCCFLPWREEWLQRTSTESTPVDSN